MFGTKIYVMKGDRQFNEMVVNIENKTEFNEIIQHK
jgi:hypothetical protein